MMTGYLLNLSYRLSRHYMGAWSLGAWLVFVGCALILLDLLPRVEIAPALQIGGGALALLALALMIWGRRRRFCAFVPGERGAAAGRPLQGLEHMRVRASGRFEVEGKTRFHAHLDALYHTFETREHSLMAHVPVTRFLLVGHSRKEDAGMWYLFIRPTQIQRIETGVGQFGRHERPAVRVTYQGAKRSEEVCLLFENEDDRQRALEDLEYDLRREPEALA
jgi:hypothetical protein